MVKLPKPHPKEFRDDVAALVAISAARQQFFASVPQLFEPG